MTKRSERLEWLMKNLSDEDLNGLIDGTKGIHDNEQPLSYDTEDSDMRSVNGAFVTQNFKADWNGHTKRWDCNIWKQLNAWGQSWQRAKAGDDQDNRDFMIRRIYDMDHRIPSDQPYFEMIGQLRLVHPWAETR